MGRRRQGMQCQRREGLHWQQREVMPLQPEAPQRQRGCLLRIQARPPPISGGSTTSTVARWGEAMDPW